MDGHGYTLIANSRSAEAGFMPSLVGVESVNPNARDVYFDRIDITGFTITNLALSRWTDPDGDPILAVKTRAGGFYIPQSELVELATETDDADLLDMLKALRLQRVGAR